MSQIFFYLCLCFILGIFASSFFYFSQMILLALLILGIFFVSVFWPAKSPETTAGRPRGVAEQRFTGWQRKRLAVLGFCIIFLVAGAWQYQLARARLERPELERFFGQEIVLAGCVLEESDQAGQKVKLKVGIKELQTSVLVTAPIYPKIEYGDKIKIQGMLKEPPVFEGFNYKNYLQIQGIYFLMSYPDVEVLEGRCGNSLRQVLISFKNTLKQSLQKIVPVPEAGFFEALIFGDEQNIPWSWKQKLNTTGVRHIAAVSGANITIISAILLDLLLYFGFWRRQALWLSIILIFFYILMIGAPSCAVRAGIMGVLLLLAQNFGRIANTERIMVFTLAFMLVSNPLLLKHDIGFQLSFLAFAGLVYLSPLFLKILKKTKVPEFCQIQISLASTLAAQIFVLPLLLYNFGQVSLVAPITNILILPTIPFLTGLGFLFSFVGIFWQGLAQVFSWPAQVLMIVIVKIIDVFSKIPWAAKKILVSGIFVFTVYILLVVFIFYLKKRQRLWFLDY